MSALLIQTCLVDSYVSLQEGDLKYLPTPTEFLRTAVLMLVNRSKARLAAAGVNHEVFHNHNPQSGATIARYPLVLYQQVEGQLIVTGINEGAEALRVLLSHYERPVEVDRNVLLGFNLHDEYSVEVKLCEPPVHYTLTDWLPLNSENYKQFAQMHRLVDKVEFLERLLLKHLTGDFGRFFNLSLAEARLSLTGVDSFSRSCLHITVNGRKRDFMPFTVSFETNVALPAFICLGNGKVYGHGLLQRVT